MQHDNRENKNHIHLGLRILGSEIEQSAKEIYGQPMGYVLLTLPYGQTEDRRSDYIGNCERSCVIEMLRETADRLERNEQIPHDPT